MRRIVQCALAALAIFATTPAIAEWHEASSDHFLIYANSDEAWLRGFADRLERVDGAMRLSRGVAMAAGGRSNRLTIFVLPSIAAVAQMCGKYCRNVAGFYVPRAGGSIAFTPKRGDNPGNTNDLTANTVLFHEYAHHIMLENFAAAYPRWFIEGFAEFNSTATIERDGSVMLGGAAQHRAYGLLIARSLPITTLLDDSKARLTAEEQDVFYGRAWLLTHLLTFDKTRESQLKTYLNLINQGKPSLEAAQIAFGDLKLLSRDMEAYLKRNSLNGMRVRADALKIGRIDLRPLTAGETATMAVHMRSERGVDTAQAKLLVPEARRRAKDFPADPAAQNMLAEAEFDAGNIAECEAAADRALATDPKSIHALMYKGLARIRTASVQKATDPAVWKAARSWLVKANRQDPDAAEPLMLFYESFLAADEKPTSIAVDGLLRAFELSPHDGGLRMMVVRQLLIEDDTKGARATLLPLAYDPHAERDNPAAKLVAMIDAGTHGPAILSSLDKDEKDPKAKSD